MIRKALYFTALAVLAVAVATAEDAGKGAQTTVIPVLPQAQDRELTGMESQELNRLEMDFAQGEITETEFAQRKRDLHRSTLPEDETLDDGILNGTRSF